MDKLQQPPIFDQEVEFLILDVQEVKELLKQPKIEEKLTFMDIFNKYYDNKQRNSRKILKTK